MADVIGTSNMWPNYSTSNVQKAARTPQKELGKEEFLQILVTQLRNQDPMQPLQDKEFIAQMAQFSSLEQSMNMSNEIKALRNSAGMVASLIGMSATWMNTAKDGTAQNGSGVITSIVWRDGVQYATINKSEVPVSDILSLTYEPADVSGANGSE